MAVVGSGETALGSQSQTVLSDSGTRAAKRGGIIDRLRELVIRAHRETTPEALGGADCQRMEDRVTDGRIVRESRRVAEFVSVVTEFAGRPLIGKSEHIKPRAFRAKISGLDEEPPSQLALNGQLPGLL